MSLEQALGALRAAKRISGASASYKKDNPGEYAKVIAYLDGGARPSGVDAFTEMGKGLVFVEDERRGVSPPPASWTHVADEWEAFTLTETSEVRFGTGSAWNSKVLAAGTYACDYHTFGDPAVGLAKVCEARASDGEPEDPPPPPPPPADLYFNGDFETGNLSQFRDFHDAHLSRTPPGFVVVPNGAASAYCARVNIINAQDTSQYGDASMLWEGPPAYDLPYLQNGQTTWFRVRFLLPNNQDSRYPGVVAMVGNSFGIIHTWHTDPGRVSAYSTNMGLYQDSAGSAPYIRLLARGGPGEGAATQFEHRDGGSSRKPLKWNHWYDSIIRITFGPTAGTGSIEWYLDGILQGQGGCPTIAVASDGSVPGLGHEAGYYRGPTKTGLEVIYLDTMRSGPTRASVEA